MSHGTVPDDVVILYARDLTEQLNRVDQDSQAVGRVHARAEIADQLRHPALAMSRALLSGDPGSIRAAAEDLRAVTTLIVRSGT